MNAPVFIAPGVCQCGCGTKTSIASKTSSARGHRKGVPVRFVHGHYGGPVKSDVAERFWANVSVGEADDCWPWTGSVNNGGYGKFWIAGQTLSAHRIAVRLKIGPIPDGLLVRHRCDNPPCCNPDHLQLGTHQQNMDDKVERGRALKGEDAGRAVLTARDVIAIRRRNAGGESQVSLARAFGVARSTIQWVLNGRNWKSVGGAL